MISFSNRRLINIEGEFNPGPQVNWYSVFGGRIEADFLCHLDSLRRQSIRHRLHDIDSSNTPIGSKNGAQNDSSIDFMPPRFFRVTDWLFVKDLRFDNSLFTLIYNG